MMKKLLFILTGIMFFCSVNAQFVWKVTDNDYLYVLNLDSVNSGSSANLQFKIRFVTIYSADMTVLVQTLMTDSLLIPADMDRNKVIVLRDVNNDEKPDLNIFCIGKEGKQGFMSWLFNEETGLFTNDDEKE